MIFAGLPVDDNYALARLRLGLITILRKIRAVSEQYSAVFPPNSFERVCARARDTQQTTRGRRATGVRRKSLTMTQDSVVRGYTVLETERYIRNRNPRAISIKILGHIEKDLTIWHRGQTARVRHGAASRPANLRNLLNFRDASAVGGSGGFGGGGDEVAEDSHVEIRGGPARRPVGSGRGGCRCWGSRDGRGGSRFGRGLRTSLAGTGCVEIAPVVVAGTGGYGAGGTGGRERREHKTIKLEFRSISVLAYWAKGKFPRVLLFMGTRRIAMGKLTVQSDS